MSVSVIIPLFNGLSFTRQMVASLVATWPAGLSGEILLVDNGSTDGTRDWLKTLDRNKFRIILNPGNAGYSAANNQAASAATGGTLALLNNDLVLLPRWLEPMLAVMRQSRATVVGNIQISTRTRQIEHAGIFFDQNGSPFHFRPAAEFVRSRAIIDTPAVTGACLLVDRRWFLDSGGFDEGYRNGYEDLDLCMRARSSGRTVVVATRSVVFHFACASQGRHDHEDLNARRFQLNWGEPARRLAGFSPQGALSTDAVTSAYDGDAFAVLQALNPSPSGYSEARSSLVPYPTRRWTRVTVAVSHIAESCWTLRVDPCNFPAIVEIASARLRETHSRRLIGMNRGAILASCIEVAGTAEIGRGSDRCLTIICTGNDPQIILKPASIPAKAEDCQDLTLELYIRTTPAT